jgi:hypothetical protein
VSFALQIVSDALPRIRWLLSPISDSFDIPCADVSPITNMTAGATPQVSLICDAISRQIS